MIKRRSMVSMGRWVRTSNGNHGWMMVMDDDGVATMMIIVTILTIDGRVRGFMHVCECCGVLPGPEPKLKLFCVQR